MQNLVLHICLPRGLALTNGARLMEEATIDVISKLTPFYASVQQVKLAGGMYLNRIPDQTIAMQIYASGQELDLITPRPIANIGANGEPVNEREARVLGAVNKWVTADAARSLLLNVIGLVGMPGSHVLANFSVTRGKGDILESVAAQLKDLVATCAFYDVTIRSNGATNPGGHAIPQMAAKGINDWGEVAPGRTWGTTGMGANAKTTDGGSVVGGRGKPIKFGYSPFFSPSYVNYRYGVYQGAYPLTIGFPILNNFNAGGGYI